MRVGVDARLLTEQVTGIGRYTYEVCKNLVSLNSDLALYLPNPIPQSICEIFEPASIRCGQAFGRVNRMIWSQTQLPKQASEDCVDVFWGATHRIPHYLDPKIARVVTIHDLVWRYAGSTMRPLSRLMESVLMPRAIKASDLVIADSVSTARGLLETYPEAEHKVRVVHLGVSSFPEPSTAKYLVALGVDKPFFLFVGTLEPRKNLGRLLEAYAGMPESLRRSCNLVVAGGRGWGGVDVKQLVESLGLQEFVNILGYVSDEALSTLYKHARFLAMPSLYEGFGLPILEALSFGTPVLTSNCSSMPEVAMESGELVDPCSVDSIRAGLVRLISSDERLNELAASSKAVASRFSWSRAASEALAVFNEAIEIRKSKSA